MNTLHNPFVLLAVRETVRHASDCGGGTGIFLAVNSSTIVVIRGKRACIWGSIYLDMFGEEDKELKYVSRERVIYLWINCLLVGTYLNLTLFCSFSDEASPCSYIRRDTDYLSTSG